MKPIVKYIGKSMLFHGQSSRPPIVQKREGKAMRNYKDRQELLAFVDAVKPSITVNGYIAITCSCGCDHEYCTKNDVPADNVVCVCGRPVITYS